MKILILSDLHNEKNFPKYDDIDLLLLLGDIPWQTVKEIDQYYICKKFGVLGNHDVWDTYRNTNIENIHGAVVEWKDLKIAGFGGAPRYNWKEHGQYEEYECKNFMDYVGKVDLFIAHSNPSFMEHVNLKDSHRGFKAFGEYIKDRQPVHFFHGHLHEEKEYFVKKTIVHSVYLDKRIKL